MKKVILLLVIIIPFSVKAISASSAIAMDLDNGRILYGYNLDEKHLIASTTKIMTCIIAIEKGDLNEKIVVSDVIYKAVGSSIYLEVGEEITLKDLLYGLMLRSGNDAALVVAEYISGSVDEFVYLMNEYRDNLGMTNTIFYNPHGLEESNGDGNLSTTRDLAKLTKYAMQNDIFRTIFKTKSYVCKTNKKNYSWQNKNKLLNLDYITGGKTGYTQKAKRTLVSTGSKNNVNVVVVTLNDPSDWDDHKKIYNNIFKNYKSEILLEKENFEIKEENYYNKEELYIKNDYYMCLTEEELKNVKIQYQLAKLKYYYNNSLVGYANILYNDEVYHKEPIYVKKIEQNKSKNNFFKKIFGGYYG